MLDYYLIRPPDRDDGNPPPALVTHPDGISDEATTDRTSPAGILVEEFELGADCSAVRLDSIGWLPGDSHWHGAAAFSRAMRTDADLGGRVCGVSRQEVEAVYRRLGGGELPDEETLRGYFDDGTPLPNSAPLWLGTGQPTAGFHQTRVYRILFTAGLAPDGLAKLLATWEMTVDHDLADPRTRVVGTARRRVGDDAFGWDLRRIGAGAAWCLDVTADLASPRDDTIEPMLRELTTAARLAGLIPVTIERFS
ncbi:hypothetical protein Pma05_65380 [Plantactinospora mayteni]|uniref:Uncharacterized protein n=1 Tax=Plantactinospora mayteni TaxID=566021 RepID=A0ABQ4EZ76_9ACTN|nr:hypothetical protein Pma05_65380 [Plantactinospora mayteni]